MSLISMPPVLVIAYRRKDQLLIILEKCKENSISRIYIALDGPKKGNVNAISENFQIRDAIKDFQRNFSGHISTLFRDHNVGCAASCLSACDWVFDNEENAIILEDDCIPSNDFFTFAKIAIEAMEKNESIWLACGTQFAPKDIIHSPWILSKYALIWGWVTSKKNWLEISSAMKIGNPVRSNLGISPWERIYWNEGARRAYGGWKDVWDTVLLQQLIANQKFAILPKTALVSNVGNDHAATHTFGESPWINLKTERFFNPSTPPYRLLNVDQWLQKKFYRITIRHIVTTRITYFVDLLNRKNIPLKPMLIRWDSANVDHQD